MYEQIATLAAGYTATIFILMISAIIFTGAFWAKTGIYKK
jgi:hypothetical protein